MKANTFEGLEVWRKAHQIALDIYKYTKNFPREEQFGLTSQMRRAVVSVPANITEGFKKRKKNDKINYYNIAQASLEELRYYLILSKDLNYLPENNELNLRIDETAKMLHFLILSIKDRD